MANQYVIRFKNGKASDPLSAEAVKAKILSGELGPEDEASVYPDQFAMKLKSYPEFEGNFKDEEATLLFDPSKREGAVHEDKTRLFEETGVSTQNEAEKQVAPLNEFEDLPDRDTQKKSTMIFERPEELFSKEEKKRSKLPKKQFLILVVLAILAYEYAYENDEPKKKPHVVMVAVRPQLPSGGTGKVDPEMSVKIYNEGLKPYAEDTVQGYRRSVDVFNLALKYDPQNVKALAMLASSYLNLIDSSNKDEKTFSVINKLIELSRVKDLALVETILAEVEFLAASGRYDGAIQKLSDYSKVNGKFDPVLYFYIGWLYSLKGEGATALKYLNLIPSSALPIPKLYYLRGNLFEENGDFDDALAEYGRALKLNPRHAKSILGLVRISEKKGTLKNSARYVGFLTSNPSLQSPVEYVSTLIFRSKLGLLFHQPDEAIDSLDRAIEIEPKNEDLRLEYYTLMAQSGKDSKYQKLAQMYALVLEGERDIRAGKNHEAVTVLLQAKDAFPKSAVPLIKMGDLFFKTGEYQKAVINYKKAVELNPKGGETAIKLIGALLKNHEWEDAKRYLAQFRSHPALKSSVDRLAGDLDFLQGNYTQAIDFYRRAMARDSIDTEVYSSYAAALSELDQCKDAQFFFSLAQRLDPYNFSAIIGSAKCLLKTDGVNAAVGRIQEELAKLPKARADLLCGIAEVYYLNHTDDKALQFVQQAKNVDSDFPESYRIEGEIYLRQMLTHKDAEKRAIEALKAYSDRKISDPYGYLRCFEIYLSESRFDLAEEQLNKVFEVSPRYPELHYRRAQFFVKLGKIKNALNELQEELKLNPRFVRALVEEGNIYARGNSLDEAMKAFVQAMEIDPQNPEAKMGAGYVNYLKRQFSSAIALYQAALALDKGNPEIHKRLGQVYRDSGDMPKATQSFRNYLDLAPDAPDHSEYERYR